MRQLELAVPHRGVTLKTERGAGRSVTQRNELIESRYNLSIQELRLVMLCASRIDPTAEIDWTEKDVGVFDVTIEDWGSVFPGHGKRAYRLLKEAAEKLFENFIEVNGKESITYHRWVTSSGYFGSQGRVKLKFTREVLELLTAVANRYTTVRFDQLTKLPTTYAWKLYMLMAQFQDTGFRIISINDFRHAMDCADQHQLYGDLKKRVIIPSLTNVNAYTNLKVSFTEVKDGRKVVKLKFRIRKILAGGAELTEGEFISEDRAEMKFDKKVSGKLEQRWNNRDWAEQSICKKA